MASGERTNQRYRTRKDLLQAASRLMKDGHQPTMAEVAKEARVSRATAYRYFDSVEVVLCEATMDQVIKSPEELFADFDSVDPVERVMRAEASIYEVDSTYPLQLRLSLSQAIKRQLDTNGKDSVPLRQNRRGPLIREALKPIEDQLKPEIYNRLCSSLALFIGMEAMIVFQDVIRIEEAESRKVKAWGIRALIEQAIQDSKSRKR